MSALPTVGAHGRHRAPASRLHLAGRLAPAGRQVGRRWCAGAAPRSGCVVVGLGPVLWLAKSAITPTPGHAAAIRCRSSRTAAAWEQPERGVDRASRSAATSGTRSCSRSASWLVADRRRDDRRLRPLGAAADGTRGSSPALLLMTLFVPAVVLLVPLYIDDRRPAAASTTRSSTATGRSGCLPARAPSTCVLVTRFFDNLPREIFEAARIDGAGPVPAVRRTIVLPMSRPILGGRLGLRRARVVEGLPLAAARPHESRQPAALGAPADDPVADRARRLPGRDVHRVPRADRRLPDLPALVPARHGAGRRASRATEARESGPQSGLRRT